MTPFPQTPLSLVLPASILLILSPVHIHSEPLMLTGVSNIPRLDYSLSSPKTTHSPSSHRISGTLSLSGPWNFHPSCSLDLEATISTRSTESKANKGHIFRARSWSFHGETTQVVGPLLTQAHTLRVLCAH